MFAIREWLNRRACEARNKKSEDENFITEIWTNYNFDFSRYVFDGELPKEDWSSYETYQDNADYGLWVNLKDSQLLMFCQGAIILETFNNQEVFTHELNTLYASISPAYVTYSKDEKGISKRTTVYGVHQRIETI